MSYGAQKWRGAWSRAELGWAGTGASGVDRLKSDAWALRHGGMAEGGEVPGRGRRHGRGRAASGQQSERHVPLGGAEVRHRRKPERLFEGSKRENEW